MRPRERRRVVFREGFVETLIVALFQLFFWSLPNRFVHIDVLPLDNTFFHFFLWNLALRFSRLSCSCGVNRCFLLDLLGHLQLDGEVDELRVFLDEFLKFVLVKKLGCVFFEVESYSSASFKQVLSIFEDPEGVSSAALPSVLDALFWMFRTHFHSLSHQKWTVEADTELSDDVHVPA